jgi:hypothetical protein
VERQGTARHVVRSRKGAGVPMSPASERTVRRASDNPVLTSLHAERTAL